jgi:hypothetical protein
MPRFAAIMEQTMRKSLIGLVAGSLACWASVRLAVTNSGNVTAGGALTDFFRNYAPPKFHAIGCQSALTNTANFACPLGGNYFDYSGDDVEKPACNAACVSTP